MFTDDTPTVPVYAGFTPAETRVALRSKTEPSYQGTFTSARNYVLKTFATTQSALMKKRVSQFMVGNLCPLCNGKRLKREALSVTFAGYDIGELSQLPLSRLVQVLTPVAAGKLHSSGETKGDVLSHSVTRKATQERVNRGGSAHAAAPDVRHTPDLSDEKILAAQRLSKDLLARLSTLMDLGLGYLAMDRSTPTLSPGELQRLRLGTQLASQLVGVGYVRDDPSAGLHPQDGQALLAALQRLKASGNSVFVVEHDLSVMQQADWLVDVGPGAGENGGRVLYSGPPAGLSHVPESETRRYLFDTHPAGAGHTPVARVARTARQPSAWLQIEGVTRNNLHKLDARFPLGCFTSVTGVSGSGKSSLVSQALVELVYAHLGGAMLDAPDELLDALETAAPTPVNGRIAAGAHAIRRLVQVDQKPIGRTPRSNLATYTGLFDTVRKLFATTPAARQRRYDAGRFSFNLTKGRCATCEGEGFVSIELLFMPSVYSPCPVCHGARYNPQTLEITWQDKNVAEVLHMTVDEAIVFFTAQAQVLRPLVALQNIGLGYLRLGQPAPELSGGEAQRIKLATELQRDQRGNTLYVLDEPTTGLHPADVDRLMLQLNRLVDAGNTVIVVEHEMRIVAQSDWVIDIGPGAGDAGGKIVAEGTPQQVAQVADSPTAVFLAAYL